jgi:hypothetical protein
MMPNIYSSVRSAAPISISGSINLLEVTNASGITPGTVIPATAPWIASVGWEINGAIQELLTGKWNIKAFLEGFGSHWTGEVAAAEIAASAGEGHTPNHRNYRVEIKVPAGVAPPGAYKLNVVVEHLGSGARPTLRGFH